MLKKWIFLFSICSIAKLNVQAQIKPKSSNEIQLGLQKLNTLGSVLYFAAHPDDENTKLIAWLAQEKKYRTGYLSLTRGDGGQNLIGTEQGIELGLIRTQELLAARSIDNGEQFFSSAYDFGFSKTHEETFSFWDKETALREAVWLIRKFQPDVIITRFPPDKRGGHGHHQASAILAHEAFIAAADPSMFPDQLQEVKPWQAKRLLWNTANFGGANNTAEDQLKINIGAYNPLLGQSYGEIAANSRSQHKSQGFGAASSRGNSTEYFAYVDGVPAKEELMDEVITSWKRVNNTEPIQQLINKLNTNFNPLQPEKSIPDLLALKKLIQKIDDNYWRAQKTKEVNELIISCAGLWVEATAEHRQYPVNTTFEVNIEALVRTPNVNVELVQVNNDKVNYNLYCNIPWKGKENSTWPQITQPYWLNLPHSLGKFEVTQHDLGNPTNSDKPSIRLVLKVNGEELAINTDIQYKTVDPVQGELYQDIIIAPTITASIANDNIIIINDKPQKVNITFTRNDLHKQIFQINIAKTNGWQISPSVIDLDFGKENTITKEIEIKPVSRAAKEGTLHLSWNNEILHNTKTIKYDHIPSITWFPIAKARIQNLQLINPVKKVAYIAGAGDLVAESLNQIGIETTLINEQQITQQILQAYDAVVVGIRYFNISDKSDQTMQALLAYAENGGTVLIQYNVNTRLNSNKIGPYPFTISRARVTEEDAKVSFDSNDQALQFPNKITATDFEGWIQERGLYFAEDIDAHYRTPILINDKNEEPSKGSLLIVDHGKGKFVYTSLSFFRQLPAGVPGAYRLFVNLLAKEK